MKLKCEGYVETYIVINRHTYNARLWITNITVLCILGREFQTKYKETINPGSQCIEFRNTTRLVVMFVRSTTEKAEVDMRRTTKRRRSATSQ